MDSFRSPHPKHILLSGVSGLVGSSLLPLLLAAGHRLSILRRSESTSPSPSPGAIESVAWDPLRSDFLSSDLECDAVVHMAGENVAARRWNQEFKRRIRDSRVIATYNLCLNLAKLKKRPAVLICASAIGYYGDAGERELTEQSPLGQGFFPETCREWEQACAPARDSGIRVVHLRIGMVLSPRGGALQKMLPIFYLGLGGRLGDGEQFISWIALDDLLAVIWHCICNDSMQGPYNAVAPHPTRNKDFTGCLARVIRRPAFIPAPAFALRLVFGEFADEGLLASARVLPQRLIESGFHFRFPTLEKALRHCLGK